MKYRIDSNLPKRAYLQLYETLREDIADGIFPFGAKLPSKRLLAEEMGISIATVEHAYALLCEEGYAISRERSGYFVSYREEDGFSSFSHSAEPAFLPKKEHLGEVFPFSVLARTMRGVLSDYGDQILVKSEGQGDFLLRLEICRYLARSRGITAAPEQIVIGSGAEYLYGFAVQLLGRDRLYAIEDPSYEKILQVYLAEGAKCEKLSLGRDGIESVALKESKADVLHITPYRSFPSGVTATAAKKREYLRWAEREGRYLIEDDFESEFTLSRKPEDTLFALGKKENVIYVNTFSKTIAPSIRAGYMVLPKSLLPDFEAKLGFYSCTVPLFEQLVLKELISSGDFERHINRVRRKKRKEREENP